ncbi:MAG: class I SAM-dependent methyltransferase [Hyphomicrobiales bacterium]
MVDSTQRFSSRVENYIRYRPHYPAGVIEVLRAECQLTPAARVADIGSGTGNLAELFLRNGNPVFAVEPNREMREAGERLMAKQPNFHSVAGRAETTTLADRSVDFVVSGQAFHWFERRQAAAEFRRILESPGWVVLAWNKRDTAATPFMKGYDRLVRHYAADYAKVSHEQVNEAVLADFFGARGYTSKSFHNLQSFDYEGLQGRLLSSSYTPESGHPDYDAMLEELSKLYRAHQLNDRVSFQYQTTVYYGRLK